MYFSCTSASKIFLIERGKLVYFPSYSSTRQLTLPGTLNCIMFCGAAEDLFVSEEPYIVQNCESSAPHFQLPDTFCIFQDCFYFFTSSSSEKTPVSTLHIPTRKVRTTWMKLAIEPQAFSAGFGFLVFGSSSGEFECHLEDGTLVDNGPLNVNALPERSSTMCNQTVVTMIPNKRICCLVARNDNSFESMPCAHL